MNKQPQFIKKRLNQIVAATVLAGLGMSAHAGEFSLEDNEIAFGGDTVTVNVSGVASHQDLASAPAAGLPNITFSLINHSDSDGDYFVRLRMQIDSQTDNDRVAMVMGVVRVTVAAGVVTGAAVVLPNEANYQQISVNATKQSGSGTTSLSSTIPANAAMISSSGASITVQVDEVYARLVGDNALFDDIIGGFMFNDHYDYKIGVESVSAPTTLSVGHFDGVDEFTAFPRLLSACSGFTVLGTLTVGNPVDALVDATAQQEDCAPTPEEENDEVVEEAGQAADDFDDAVSGGDPQAGADALDNYTDSLIDAGNNDEPLNDEQIEAIQEQVSGILDGAETLLANADTAEEQNLVINSLNNLIENLATANVPATEALVERIAEVARASAEASIRRELGEDATDAEITTALENDPNLRAETLASTLRIPPVEIQSRSQVVSNIVLNYDFSTTISNTLADLFRVNLFRVSFNNDFIGMPDLIRRFFVSPGNLSLTDGRTGTVAALEADEVSIETNSVTGVTTIVLPGESYAGSILGVRPVPDFYPEGIEFRADGTVLLVANGYAVELASIALDSIAFAAEILEAGYDYEFRADRGALRLDLGGQLFSGVFAYDNLNGKNLDAADCTSVSIVEPTGPLNAASYAFGVNCSSGVNQRVLPYVDADGFFDSLDAMDLDYTFDRNTGFLTVPGTGTFKPSFFVSPATSAETTFFNANKDASGVAYIGGDFNADGKLDFKVISSSGVQLLYGTN